MAGHKALGRGLDALFSNSSRPKTEASAEAGAPGASGIQMIPVAQIKPNRFQPRTEFDPAALEELSQSIKQHGIAQPLMVTVTSVVGEYELVVGERRLRASKLAGLETVPCTVKTLTNRERFEIALIENIQRQDLNALEEAVALDGLMKEYDLTQEQVAAAIGKSRSAVANVLRLLRLHEDVQAAVRNGTITEGHAKALAGVSEHSEQLRLLNRIVTENLNVRDIEAIVAEARQPRKPAAEKAERPVLPEVQKYQDEFQRALGRRVEIQSAGGKKGWIRFEFYTPADLDELCGKLGLLKKPAEVDPTA